MSQHNPPFPPHLPRGAVAASALTLPKNSVTTVLRGSPAIQIPAAPSVSVSVPGLPTALVRNPVISAIRPGTPPTTRAQSPAVGMTDHSRTNLIVQGATGVGPPLPGQPMQFTLTQRVNPNAPTVGMVNPGAATVGISEAMKLTPLSLSGKTVQVAQPGLLAHQKLAVGAQAAPGSITGINMAPHLQQQAVLAASKAGGLQLTGAMPAVSISSLSAAAIPTTTVMASTATAIPVAKVTPQRQLTSALPASIAVQTTSGSEFTTIADLSSMSTQTGASQLLLSQTPRSQAGAVVTATTVPALTGAIPTAVTSLTAQHGERTLAPTLFNLTAAAAPGSGGQVQDAGNVWLQHFIYQPPRTPLVSTTPNTASPIIRTPAANTFFVPRQGADQSKITSQTPNLAASLSNTVQPTMLFSTQMMVDGGQLRQTVPHQLPLNAATATISAAPAAAAAAAAGAAASSVSTLVTGVGGHAVDGKSVLSLTPGSNSGPPTLQASLVSASTAASAGSGQSESISFPSSTSLHMAVNMAAAAGNAGVSVLSPNLALASVNSLASRATVASRATIASSLISVAAAHQAQASSSQQSQGPSTPGGSGSTSAGTSPRPSILRKRTVDGNSVVPRKPNFSLMAESHSPRPETAPQSNISSPKTPATENSQSSTDTALSSNDANTPTHATQGDLKLKVEPNDAGGHPEASPAVGNISDASPRKRARKQLFDVSCRTVSEEVKPCSSSDEESDSKSGLLIDIKQEHPLRHQDEFIDREGVRWTKEKTKQSMSIMSEYSMNWKPKLNHYQRLSDIRPKEDRNPTVNELISHRGILQKASGWKLYHVCTQLEAVIENEESMEHRMEKLGERLAALSSKPSSHASLEIDYEKLLELFRGNLQRCQLVQQQMLEAKNNMLNLLKHEPKIKEIITKNLAKRTIKKKERS